MVEHRWRKGTAGYVADIAILGCCHMGRIGLRTLTGCIDTIVAGITPLTHNFRSIVVDKRIEEISRVMAYGTIPCRVVVNRRICRPPGTYRNMIRTAIMARGTVTADTRVHEWCYLGNERSIRVTDVTILGRWYMTERLSVEPACGRAEATIVATFATSGDALMDRGQERRRGKYTRGIVTHTAVILCRDVIHDLGCRDTRVMTGRAVVGIYAQVVKGYACKADKIVDVVTGRAIQACRQMIRRFSKTDVTVMA